jgi:hypothetical protein
MRHTRLLLTAIALAFWTGCAQIVVPSGGPKDVVGPEFVTASPAPGTLNFKGNKLVFGFNEFLKQGDMSRDIFLSPRPEVTPQVYAKNRNLEIRFRAPLRDSTTYSITLGTSIKDFNEGNALTNPLVYAFSTGPKIDTGVVVGFVRDGFSDLPRKGVRLLLFPPDSIKGNNFYRKQPLYVGQSDSSGNFIISYIKTGDYRILALADMDETYSLSLPTEQIGIYVGDTLNVRGDSIRPKPIRFRLFQPDTTGPRVSKVERVGQGEVQLSFSEPLNKLKSSSDSTEYVFRADETPRRKFNLLLQNNSANPRIQVFLTDTAGNTSDTVLSIPAMTGKPPLLHLTRDTTELKRSILRYETNRLLPDTVLRHFHLRDSTGRELALKAKQTPWAITFLLDAARDTAMRYTLVADSSLASLDSTRWDTLPIYRFKGQEPQLLGTITGEVDYATAADTSLGPLQLILTDRDTKRNTYQTLNSQSRTFVFKRLVSGTYQLAAFIDANKDGRWTPGDLRTGRQPERGVRFADVLRLRPGWEIESDKLLFPAANQ